MPIYAYGIKRNPLFWQGNKIGTAYRYGTKVYQSRIPEWSQAAINNMSLARNYAAVTAIPMSNVVLVAGGISQEGGGLFLRTALSPMSIYTTRQASERVVQIFIMPYLRFPAHT